MGTSSGRRVFGATKPQIQDSSENIRSNNYYGNTDSEDDFETKDVDVGHTRKSYVRKDVTVDPSVLRDKSQIGHDDLFKVRKYIVLCQLFLQYIYMRVRDRGSLILIVVCRVLMKLSRTQGPRQHMMLPYSPAIHGKKLDMTFFNCFTCIR